MGVFTNIHKAQASWLEALNNISNPNQKEVVLKEKQFNQIIEKGETNVYTFDGLKNFMVEVLNARQEGKITDEDVEKARKDIGKLQKVIKQVKRNGKIFNQTMYVAPKQADTSNESETANGYFLTHVKGGLKKEHLEHLASKYDDLSHINKIRFEREYEKTMGKKFGKQTDYHQGTKDKKESVDEFQKRIAKKQIAEAGKKNVADKKAVVTKTGENKTTGRTDFDVKYEDKKEVKPKKNLKEIEENNVRNMDAEGLDEHINFLRDKISEFNDEERKAPDTAKEYQRLKNKYLFALTVKKDKAKAKSADNTKKSTKPRTFSELYAEGYGTAEAKKQAEAEAAAGKRLSDNASSSGEQKKSFDVSKKEALKHVTDRHQKGDSSTELKLLRDHIKTASKIVAFHDPRVGSDYYSLKVTSGSSDIGIPIDKDSELFKTYFKKK